MMRWRWVLILAAGVAAGCASTVPEPVREAPSASPSVAEVQRAAPGFLGQRVRWGGTILAVRNGPETTQIEILARPLRRGGEPRGAAAGEGRFIAEFAKFLDPAEYPEGRRLTVTGRLARLDAGAVGDFRYQFPVVVAEASHLWPEPVEAVVVSPSPLWHPWYDPWTFRAYRPWVGPW